MHPQYAEGRRDAEADEHEADEEEADTLLAAMPRQDPRLSESLRVRVFLELTASWLVSVSYLEAAIRSAGANVSLDSLHTLPAPSNPSFSPHPSPAEQMWGQRVIDYLLHELVVQEFRAGDLMVFPGELLEGLHFVQRGQVHPYICIPFSSPFIYYNKHQNFQGARGGRGHVA